MINNPTFQTYTAIAIVIICVAWLVLRVWMKRKNPGCGSGDCGCSTDEFKRKLAKQEKAKAGEEAKK